MSAGGRPGLTARSTSALGAILLLATASVAAATAPPVRGTPSWATNETSTGRRENDLRPVSSLTTYDAHSGAELSEQFTVSVGQQASAIAAAPPVYSSTSTRRCSEIPAQNTKDECWCKPGHSQAWASLWFTGAPVTVTVHNSKSWGSWEQVVLRPRRANITMHKINATALSFVLPPSALGYKLSLESAGQMDPLAACDDGFPPIVGDSLMIFADPGSMAPDPGSSAPDTLYFGPGLHDLGGQMVLPANVSRVYIAGGAWVGGGFITEDASASVSISGRGVISGSAQTFLKDPAGFGPCSYNGSYCWSLVNLDKGATHRLEGVVLHDPPKYFFRSYAKGVTLHGVKMLGAWTHNTDGVVTGEGGRVTDCFIQSNDDSIKLFTSSMRVSDVVVWQMSNGGVFQMGWWGSHDQRDILVERVTVLHADYKTVDEEWARSHPQNDAIIDLRGPGGNTLDPSAAGIYNISNITWRDIVIDSVVHGGGLVRLDLAAATGSLTGLTFERVSVPGAMPSSVATAKGQTISGLAFVELEVAGSCVKTAAAAGFGSQPASVGLTFGCSASDRRARSLFSRPR